MANTVSSTKTMPTRILLRKENTRIIPLLMFYENIKNMMFKVLISFLYCIMYNYLCVDSPSFPQTKLHVNFSNRGFGKNIQFCFRNYHS